MGRSRPDPGGRSPSRSPGSGPRACGIGLRAPHVEAIAAEVGPGAATRIDGSIGLPLSQLPARADELARDRPIIVHCAGGYRSSIAASLLRARGFTRVSELAGGLAAWDTAGLPLST